VSYKNKIEKLHKANKYLLV